MPGLMPLVTLVASSTASNRIKALADYACDGVNDEVEINQAISDTAAAGAVGGLVQLTGGNYDIGNFNAGPIKMRRGVILAGVGQDSTTITCRGTWAGHDGIAQGGCIEPLDNTQDRWEVRALTITANWGDHDTRGVYANISSNTGFIYGADSMLVFSDLYIRGMKRSGLDIRGAFSRKNVVNNVQIFDMGDATFVVDGVYWDSNDSHFFALDCGDCTGYGVNLNGPNNRFVACKSFFSGRSGWNITGVRNELSSCEAQDNKEHGFIVAGIDNTLAACFADSNSYDGSPSGGITGRTFHGFYVSVGANTLAACNSRDKNEGARGLRQVYGYYLDTGVTRMQIHGIANDNFTGQVGGPGIDGALNNIQVTGSQASADASVVRFVGSAMGSEITFWRSEATLDVANQGTNLPVALTELDSGVLGTRKLVESLDIGSQVQIVVTIRNMAATADTVTVSIRDTSNTANVLATVAVSIPASITTTSAKSTYAAKPAWLTGDKTLAVYTSHTGAATLDYIFKDVTLRQRP